ncbi:MAG: efflux RND transporter permease subunit [Bacteroidales bacterium]|nr:efflux RND transporter permease subunit [Bacteroidales bacterium]
MRKITEFSVRYPVTVTMLVLAVVLLGYISFGKLGTDLFPKLNNPRIYVELQAGERPPEEVEKSFVDPIESVCIRQSEVVGVTSVTRVGTAQITVEYAWNKDMDDAFLELQKALGTYSQNSEITSLTITQHDPNESPVMLVAMRHETLTDMDELRQIGENYLRNELVRLEGVADVQMEGQEQKEVLISTDPYLLNAFGVTTSEITSQITNYNKNVSGGSIVEMGTQYVIKGVSVFENLNDIQQLIVGFKTGTAATATTGTTASASSRVPVFLKDVAKVEFKNKEPDNIVRINGQRAIGLAIFKEPSFNTVKAVEQLNEEFVKLQKSLPGYTFEIIQDQGSFISSAIDEVKSNAIIGMLLAVFVMFLFFRRIGSTLIASAAIPISIIATFTLMYFNGLSLNLMTLGGLALGVGMLVDNAIVVIESIFRHMEQGMSIREACIEGASSVGGAICAVTLTHIVVFLPIVFLHGASGELFKDMAWTVAFSLICSLVVAMLVIPMLFDRFMKPANAAKQVNSIGFKWYPALLEKFLKNKWLIIGLSILLMAGSAMLIKPIGSEFMPRTEAREFSLDIRLPEGTQLTRTDEAVKTLEQMITELLGKDLKNMYVRVGPAASSTTSSSIFESENTANIKISLNPKASRSSDILLADLGKIFTSMPEIQFSFTQDETALQAILGTDEAPVVVEVVGKDFTQIERLTGEVEGIMNSNTDLFNIQSSIQPGAPEVELVIDRYRAGMYNVTIDQITNQVTQLLTGTEAGKFDYKGEMTEIRLKLPDVEVSQLQDIALKVGTSSIRLGDVADVRQVSAPKEILRTNQNRVGKVSAQFKGDKPIDQVIVNLDSQLRQVVLPPGYTIRQAGEELKRKESMKTLGFALLLSLILVYMVLASQFESIVHPFTIMLTIPLAGVGTVLLFFFLKMPFSMMAYIGIIMLAGIAVSNAILLLDAINRCRMKGMNRHDAILEAGLQRIRPILMTSLTTVLGLVPMTLGFGQSVSLRAPMALAVIGGMVTSTILTLIVIPCFYDVIDRVTSGKKYANAKHS